MEILFVVDEVKDIERKISLFENIGAKISFFVNSNCVKDIIERKEIVEKIVAIYKNNVNVTIDKYIRTDNYQAQPTILYYSSAELTPDIIESIRERLKINPDTIYVKKKFNFWQKFKLWFYQKLIKGIFGLNDEFASIKLQYFSKDLMEACVTTSFKNHIFTIINATTIELDKSIEKTYYTKPKFNKYSLLNPIVICFILICYVVAEKFFKLPFWTYLLFIALILSTIMSWIAMAVKSRFDTRYRK